MIKRHEEMIQSQYELHTKKKVECRIVLFQNLHFWWENSLMDFGGYFSWEQICICKRF